MMATTSILSLFCGLRTGANPRPSEFHSWLETEDHRDPLAPRYTTRSYWGQTPPPPSPKERAHCLVESTD